MNFLLDDLINNKSINQGPSKEKLSKTSEPRYNLLNLRQFILETVLNKILRAMKKSR